MGIFSVIPTTFKHSNNKTHPITHSQSERLANKRTIICKIWNLQTIHNPSNACADSVMDICALSKIRYLVRARPEICTWLGGIMFAVDSSVSFGIKYDGAVSWHTFEREIIWKRRHRIAHWILSTAIASQT